MTAALERAEAANPGDDDLAEIREVAASPRAYRRKLRREQGN